MKKIKNTLISKKKALKIIYRIIRKKITINIKIKNKIEIKKINKKYKNINKTTDILTFKNEINQNKIIDIILCPEIIREKHKKNWKKIILHGVLHILKYNHEKIKEHTIMTQLQNKLGMSGIEPPTITTSK